ncbi:hypothetical protein [Streptomyces sp. H27-D2]|uniref:hypothetical protein n=1 Tax=Streptomyces sp. H27-D2 TaxID=3046304 RepID=UPI002DB7C168|nr:hypothetical protein [Streptomyces sp. H27-D2]MEC4019416.1 hypothetical protein [Streptomyces sp. H27-D2]
MPVYAQLLGAYWRDSAAYRCPLPSPSPGSKGRVLRAAMVGFAVITIVVATVSVVG